VPPFGGLRGNVHGSSMASLACRKARGRLPISALPIELFFASFHGRGALSDWSKLWCLKRGCVTLSANFRGKGVVHQRLIATENYSPWAITWHCLRDSTFSRFDTIPACDRHTDRHTMTANTRASLARVKMGHVTPTTVLLGVVCHP